MCPPTVSTMFHDAHLLALDAHHAPHHDFLDAAKCPDDHLYLQHTVQIIQLVEGPPPPPRNLASVINDSATSSSYASSSAYSSSVDDDHEEDDEQEEGEDVCESYCSSDQDEDQDLHAPPTDTYSLRMKRILAWRENFSAHLSATLSEPALPSSLKRKLTLDDEDDNASHSSKRSRSLAPSSVSGSSSLGLHPCPACDASFDTEQSLRQHGTDATANEACSVAVEYAFE